MWAHSPYGQFTSLHYWRKLQDYTSKRYYWRTLCGVERQDTDSKRPMQVATNMPHCKACERRLAESKGKQQAALTELTQLAQDMGDYE